MSFAKLTDEPLHKMVSRETAPKIYATVVGSGVNFDNSPGLADGKNVIPQVCGCICVTRQALFQYKSPWDETGPHASGCRLLMRSWHHNVCVSSIAACVLLVCTPPACAACSLSTAAISSCCTALLCRICVFVPQTAWQCQHSFSGCRRRGCGWRHPADVLGKMQAATPWAVVLVAFCRAVSAEFSLAPTEHMNTSRCLWLTAH
jgi:hypothetical protein